MLLVPADEHASDTFLVRGQVLELPVARVDRGLDVDMHGSGPRVQSLSGIGFARNGDEEGDDGQLQIGGEMERALVEMSDLAGGDALSLGAEVHGFTRSPQSPRGAFEYLSALFRKRLWNRPEDPDQVSDEAQGKELAEEPGEEKPRVGQAHGDQDEHVDRRGVVLDVDGLRLGKGPVLVHDETDFPQRERPVAQRRDYGLAVQSRKPKRGDQR